MQKYCLFTCLILITLALSACQNSLVSNSASTEPNQNIQNTTMKVGNVTIEGMMDVDSMKK